VGLLETLRGVGAESGKAIMGKDVAHSLPLASNSVAARQKLSRLAKMGSRRRALATFPSGKVAWAEPAGSEPNAHLKRPLADQPIHATQKRLIAITVAFAIAIPAAMALLAHERGSARAPVDWSFTTSSEMPRGMHAETPALAAPWPLVTGPSTGDLPALGPPSWSPPRSRPLVASLKPPKPHPDLDAMNLRFTSKPLGAP
jgi:hypothetical protein